MQLDDVGVVQFAENVNLVDESFVVLYTSLLNHLNCELLVGGPVLRQVHLSEGSIGQLLLEVIHFLNFTFIGIYKHILRSFLFLAFNHELVVFTRN